MHTAQQLREELFEISIATETVTMEDLLTWRSGDRVGVVVTEPLGALGASLMIELGITAFYDDLRRAGSSADMYPEFYAFHVGGAYGDLSFFDFWPPNKEVQVVAEPWHVLAAINDRAITHLIVPDGASIEPSHFNPWNDLAAGRRRIRIAFAYSPTGRTKDGDVAIRATGHAALENVEWSLDPALAEGAMAEYGVGVDSYEPLERAWLDQLTERQHEVTEADRETAVRRRTALLDGGLPLESYRRISLDEAFGMLVPATTA